MTTTLRLLRAVALAVAAMLVYASGPARAGSMRWGNVARPLDNGSDAAARWLANDATRVVLGLQAADDGESVAVHVNVTGTAAQAAGACVTVSTRPSFRSCPFAPGDEQPRRQSVFAAATSQIDGLVMERTATVNLHVVAGRHAISAALYSDVSPPQLRQATTEASTVTLEIANTTLEEQSTSPEYWRSVCPDLRVLAPRRDAPDVDASVPIPPSEVDRFKRSLRSTGYFVSDRHPPSEWALPAGDATGVDAFTAMASCIVTLRQHGWPGVFVFLFDEPWLLMQRLASTMRGIFGEDAMMLQVLWAYHVDYNDKTHGEKAGWFPHRDRPWHKPEYGPLRPRPDTWPPSMNVWVPLTTAAADNGCMYILPKTHDEELAHAIVNSEAAARHKNATGEDMVVQSRPTPFEARAVRSLPAEPGQFMGWDGDVLHWGSQAHEDTVHAKRISINFEVARTLELGKAVTERDHAFWPLGLDPSWGFRLRAVDSSVKMFQHLGGARVLPQSTAGYLLTQFRGVVDARVECPDCALLRGGVCELAVGDPLPRDPMDEAQCPKRRMR